MPSSARDLAVRTRREEAEHAATLEEFHAMFHQQEREGRLRWTGGWWQDKKGMWCKVFERVEDLDAREDAVDTADSPARELLRGGQSGPAHYDRPVTASLPRIIQVEYRMPRPMPLGMFDPMPVVKATFDDGTSKELFSFYPDEIRFDEGELVGLTEPEAHSLYRAKDQQHLQSR